MKEFSKYLASTLSWLRENHAPIYVINSVTKLIEIMGLHATEKLRAMTVLQKIEVALANNDIVEAKQIIWAEQVAFEESIEQIQLFNCNELMNSHKVYQEIDDIISSTD